MAIAVWATSRSAPGHVCEDARVSPVDSGQPGWDIGIHFQTLTDLVSKLVRHPGSGIANQKISRLAINAHGAPGTFDINSGQPYLSVDTLGQFKGDLSSLNLALSPGAVVLMMGCNSGQGPDGSKLVEQLSLVFPGRRVVCFTTTGVTMRQYRSGQGCTNPGMRDTDFDNPASTPEQEAQRYQGTLLSLPWADENSKHAKVAVDGKITKNPEPDLSAAPSFIVGKWLVAIGGWQGQFVFAPGGTLYWTNSQDGWKRHPGKWTADGGTFQWKFDDDPPGWQRTFVLDPPLNFISKGHILPAGQGFFEITKLD